MLRNVALLITLVAILPTSNADTLATTRTWTRQLSLVTSGDSWKKDCDLVLFSEGYQSKAKVSLKQKDGLCPLFGPVMLFATDSTDHKSTIVFVEAARGGDGEHTGPILVVYSLSKNEFKKLGEQELFDAIYQRKNDVIVSVTGKVLFSFCDVCDGPDVADLEDNIFIPAELTFGCGGVCVKPTLTKQGSNAFVSLFSARKANALKDRKNEEYSTYANNLERRFSEFIHRK
jgi:hypothetical protein